MKSAYVCISQQPDCDGRLEESEYLEDPLTRIADQIADTETTTASDLTLSATPPLSKRTTTPGSHSLKSVAVGKLRADGFLKRQALKWTEGDTPHKHRPGFKATENPDTSSTSSTRKVKLHRKPVHVPLGPAESGLNNDDCDDSETPPLSPKTDTSRNEGIQGESEGQKDDTAGKEWDNVEEGKDGEEEQDEVESEKEHKMEEEEKVVDDREEEENEKERSSEVKEEIQKEAGVGQIKEKMLLASAAGVASLSPQTHTDTSPHPTGTPVKELPQNTGTIQRSLSLRRSRKRTLATPSRSVAQNCRSATPQVKRAKSDELTQEEAVEMKTANSSLPSSTPSNVEPRMVVASQSLTTDTTKAVNSVEKQITAATPSPSKRGALSLRHRRVTKPSVGGETVSRPGRNMLQQQPVSVAGTTSEVLQHPSTCEPGMPNIGPEVRTSFPLKPCPEQALPSQSECVREVFRHQQTPETLCNPPISVKKNHSRNNPPCLYAPPGVVPSEYTPQIIQCFDDYISQLRHAQSEVLDRIRWGKPVKAHSKQKSHTLEFKPTVSRSPGIVGSTGSGFQGNRHQAYISRSERAARRSAKKDGVDPSEVEQGELQIKDVSWNPKSRTASSSTPTKGSLSAKRKVLGENVPAAIGEERDKSTCTKMAVDALPVQKSGASNSPSAVTQGRKRGVLPNYEDSGDDFEVSKTKPNRDQCQFTHLPYHPASGTASSLPTPEQCLEPSQNRNILLVDSSPEPSEVHGTSGSPTHVNSSDETPLYEGIQVGRDASASVKGKRMDPSPGSQWLSRKRRISSSVLKESTHGGEASTSAAKKRRRVRVMESDSDSASESLTDEDGAIKGKTKAPMSLRKGILTGPCSQSLMAELLEKEQLEGGEEHGELDGVHSPSPPLSNTLIFPVITRGKRQKRSSEVGGLQPSEVER